MGFGFYVPMQTYDMCSGTISGSMNLFANANWDDLIARQHLYDVPLMNFDNFMPYAKIGGGMDYLLDPSYTMQQMNWANNSGFGGIGGGFGNFGNFGGFGGNFGNGFGGVGGIGGAGNSPWGNWGWNGSNSGSGNGGTGTQTAEDKTYARKYNTLLSIVKQLSKYDGLTGVQKDTLEAAIKNTKGKPEEKFNNLKEAYDTIGADTVREFLINSSKLGTSKDLKGKEGENSFQSRLIDSGYEFDNTWADESIDSLHDAIKTLKDSNGNLESNEILGALQAKMNSTSDVDKGQTDILDLTSTWNTAYKDSANNDKRIITYIAEYYNALSDDESRSTAKSKVLDPVVKSLISKARAVKGSLDADSRNAIEDAITEVNSALDNSTTTIDSKLSDAFDNLYLLTRLGAMNELRGQIKGMYGDVDPEVFNDTLFEAETVADLQGEGFNTDSISEVKTKVKVRENNSSMTSEERRADEARREVEAVAELIADTEILTPIEGKLGYYKESKATGDREEPRTIRENGGLLYVINDDGTETKTTASEIRKAYNESVKKEEKQTELGKYKHTDDKTKEYNKIGEDMQDCLHGYTKGCDWDEFDELLKKVDEYNVMDVIAGFNEEGNGMIWNSDRFFTQLMSEDVDDQARINRAKDKMIKAIVKFVDDNIGNEDYSFDDYDKTAIKDAKAVLNKADASGKELDDAYQVIQKKFKVKDKNRRCTTLGQWGVTGAGAVLGAAGLAYAGAKAGAALGVSLGPVGGVVGGAIGALVGWAISCA